MICKKKFRRAIIEEVSEAKSYYILDTKITPFGKTFFVEVLNEILNIKVIEYENVICDKLRKLINHVSSCLDFKFDQFYICKTRKYQKQISDKYTGMFVILNLHQDLKINDINLPVGHAEVLKVEDGQICNFWSQNESIFIIMFRLKIN